jgi:hypothetical protein
VLLLISFAADDIDGLDDDDDDNDGDVSFLMLGKDTFEILGRRGHNLLLVLVLVELLLLLLLRRLKLILLQC